MISHPIWLSPILVGLGYRDGVPAQPRSLVVYPSVPAAGSLSAAADGDGRAEPGGSFTSHARTGFEARVEPDDGFGGLRGSRERGADQGRGGTRQLCEIDA